MGEVVNLRNRRKAKVRVDRSAQAAYACADLLEPGWPAGQIDTDTAHPARMYDYYLDGKDNYEVDRAAAERVRRRDRVCAASPATGRTPIRDRRAEPPARSSAIQVRVVAS